MAISSDWPIDALSPNGDNPRTDIRSDPGFDGLVASIRSQGIITPLLITEDGMILAGHRRHEAALVIGLERVPVRVLKNKSTHHLIPLIENLQRSDLNVLEAADYFLKCNRDHGMSIASISEATGISAGTVGKYLKLAGGPAEVRERIERDEIPLNAAFELLRHEEPFIQEVIKTPRLTKQIVRERARTVQPATTPTPKAVDNNARASAPLFTVRTGCPTERKSHLEYAIKVVGELLNAAPDESFVTRYSRWINIMGDDLADIEAKQEPTTFRGASDAFQRQPKERAKARA
jgi:ParB/RepB/Spo0J family partition protein